MKKVLMFARFVASFRVLIGARVHAVTVKSGPGEKPRLNKRSYLEPHDCAFNSRQRLLDWTLQGKAMNQRADGFCRCMYILEQTNIHTYKFILCNGGMPHMYSKMN